MTRAAGSNVQQDPQLVPYSYDPGMIQESGPTRITATKQKSRVRKLAMLT